MGSASGGIDPLSPPALPGGSGPFLRPGGAACWSKGEQSPGLPGGRSLRRALGFAKARAIDRAQHCVEKKGGKTGERAAPSCRSSGNRWPDSHRPAALPSGRVRARRAPPQSPRPSVCVPRFSLPPSPQPHRPPPSSSPPHWTPSSPRPSLFCRRSHPAAAAFSFALSSFLPHCQHLAASPPRAGGCTP